MGTSLTSLTSEDGAAEPDAEAGPVQVNAKYLHWLLSDPARVQEAFKPVWRASSASDAAASAPRQAVLGVILRVVAEFDLDASAADEGSPAIDGSPAGRGTSKTSRQLSQVVAMMPEWLTRTEALHLFRVTLLSAQATLATVGNGEGDDLSSQSHSASPSTQGPASPTGGDVRDNGAGSSCVDPPTRVVVRKDDIHPSVAGVTPGGLPEMLPRGSAAQHLAAMQAATLPQPGAALPTRNELEAENERLWNLSELLEASVQEEVTVVRNLEEELQIAGQGADCASAPFMLEVEAHALQQEAAMLACEVRVSNGELSSREALVSGQQKDLAKLTQERAEEEAVVDTLCREERDIARELRGCLRQCSSLDGEIASEEARSAALREAFEGRRARFATAEAAAHNAELSTMRATRRRVAAETSARNEWCAVEDARLGRDERSAEMSARLGALSAEVEQARDALASTPVAQSAEGAGTSLRSSASTAAETTSLRALQAELLLAQVERDAEQSTSERVASELGQMQRARNDLTGLLASGERGAPRRPAGDAGEIVAAEENMAEAIWAEAREVGAQFAEAEAAFLRQSAERQHGASATVSLRQSLEDAKQRAAQSSDQLEAVFAEVMSTLERRQQLQARISLAESAATVGRGAVFRAAQEESGADR